ncbi:MAG: response regulator transcription factor [Planctomycetota bacterium]|nr:response regulator transcription factor [Planctomycetota bacterium]
MPKEPRILVVEDDIRIRRELLDALRSTGFEVDVAVSYRDALISSEREYALILLDLGLPDGDGLDLVRHLRGNGRGVPILILTARDTPDSRVRGLDAGADDYVVKPFHMPELVARVKSILRRSGRVVGQGMVQLDRLWIDAEARKAGKDEAEVTLKPREFDLLLFLMQHPGRTWTRDQLLDRVWGAGFTGDARTVDLHVRRLRAKIEDDSSDPRFIETVWGVGYRMAEPQQVR